MFGGEDKLTLPWVVIWGMGSMSWVVGQRRCGICHLSNGYSLTPENMPAFLLIFLVLLMQRIYDDD